MDPSRTALRRLAPVVVAFALATTAVGTAFAIDPPEPDRIAFGQVGIAFGQSVELSVVNVGRSDPPEPDAPAMELLILDQGGNILARSIEKVAAGQSVTLRFIDPPEPERPAARIVTNFEVFDNFTGRTSFAICPCGRPGADSQLRAP